MLKIHVDNPYFEHTYETTDITIEDWKNFIENHQRGNEEIIAFEDKTSGEYITINPKNWASIQVC